MTENQKKQAKTDAGAQSQDSVDHESNSEPSITPSETHGKQTGDPGRTPGKAEGEDDSSATTTGNG